MEFASRHPSSAKSLLRMGLCVLECAEGIRCIHPELSGLIVATIRASHLGVDLLPEPPSFSQQSGCSEMSGNGGAIGRVGHLFVVLEACLRRVFYTLQNLKEKKPNFFGIFRQQFYLDEIGNFERKLIELSQTVSVLIAKDNNAGAEAGAGAGAGGSSAAAPFPFAAQASGDRGTDRAEQPDVEMSAASGSCHNETAEDLITNMAAKLFWLKYFGKACYEVEWKAFHDAFIEEYSEQPPVSMEKLKQELATLSGGVGGGGDQEEEPHAVNVVCFDAFCMKHDGLYESFQQLVDPARVVYVMGTVEDDPQTVKLSPTLVEGLLGLSVTQVCCGGQHAAVLTDTGSIYTWGRGGFGRLGHGDDASAETPRLVEALEGSRVTQVACGFAYTAAVTVAGELFTWGAGENGRLGVGDVDDRNAPTMVEAMSGYCVRQVFAGSVHTCVLTQEGSIYSFGKHEYTGHGGDEDVLLPELLDAFQGKNVCQISVGPGGYHTIALTVTGDVYTWGHNRVGQLGYANSESDPRNVEGAHFLPKPRLVASLCGRGVCQVVAGWGHSAVLTTAGLVHICGRNFQGQLGLGDPSDFQVNERGHPFQASFRQVQELSSNGRHVVQIACGGEHTAALLDPTGASKLSCGDGEGGGIVAGNLQCFTFGAGHRGQLGHGSEENQPLPQLITFLKSERRQLFQVACGNNCTMVLAGAHNPPSLFDLAVETILRTDSLRDRLDQSGLPSDIIDRIMRSKSSC